MSELVQFEYELPSGDLILVNALVSPGRPALPASLNFPGEPGEGPEIEDLYCFLKDQSGINPPFDPTGLWYWAGERFKKVIADLEDYAEEQYRDQQ
tara:strand:+ start:5894 stop:6181 length:288 start_codon:yes stop_codon:yes gene_type:complete